jgi:transketolase
VNNRVYCLLGDGEISEGSCWEAFNFASYFKLNNLVVIIDINRLCQSDSAPLEHNVDTYIAKFDAFGFNSLPINDHDFGEIIGALEAAKEYIDKPTAILARTFKGKYFTEKIESLLSWHGKLLGGKSATVIEVVEILIQDKEAKATPTAPDSEASQPDQVICQVLKMEFKNGDKKATRKSFGDCLKLLGEAHSEIIRIDVDVKNSTMLQLLKDVRPDQFIDCFIAEQNLVGPSFELESEGGFPSVQPLPPLSPELSTLSEWALFHNVMLNS